MPDRVCDVIPTTTTEIFNNTLKLICRKGNQVCKLFTPTRHYREKWNAKLRMQEISEQAVLVCLLTPFLGCNTISCHKWPSDCVLWLCRQTLILKLFNISCTARWPITLKLSNSNTNSNMWMRQPRRCLPSAPSSQLYCHMGIQENELRQ